MSIRYGFQSDTRDFPEADIQVIERVSDSLGR